MQTTRHFQTSDKRIFLRHKHWSALSLAPALNRNFCWPKSSKLKKKSKSESFHYSSFIPPQTLALSAASELLLCRGHHKSSHSLLFTWHGAGTVRRLYRDLPTTTVHMSVGRSRISSEAIASGHLGPLFIDHLTGIPHLATLFTGWLLVNEVKANLHWILQRTRLFLSRLAASPSTATLHKPG